MNLSFKLNKKSDLVFEYLTDVDKFVSVHPVIFQADKIEDDRYLIHETLKFTFIPFSFTYPATIEKNTEGNRVVMKATVFKLTKIEMTFALRSEGDHTNIEENIQFKSPLPVKAIMQNIFRKQHTQLFKNIEMK